MRVSIKSKQKNVCSSGKTTTAQVFSSKIEICRGYRGRPVRLFISGKGEDYRGSGQRGGDMKEFDKEVDITLEPHELQAMLNKALESGLISLPGKESLLKAQEFLATTLSELFVSAQQVNSVD